MKILHLECATSFGGSVTCLERYLRNKRKSPSVRDTVVFYWRFDGQDRFAGCASSVRVLFDEMAPSLSLGGRIRRNARLFLKLYGEIKDADIIHLNNGPTAHRAAIMAARHLGKPVVAHLRSFPAEGSRAGECLRMLPQGSVALAVSSEIERSYRCEGPFAAHVVYDGVEHAAEDALDGDLRKELLKGRSFLVGYVGRLVSWKGAETFIRAAVDLVSKGTDIRFVLIGREEPTEPGYRRYLEGLAAPAGDSVLFAGEVLEGIGRYMRCLDALILPSFRPEPFGMTMLEAMALNVPVIATRQGGPAEVIEEGTTGLLFGPGDSGALAALIEGLSSDREKRSRISRNAALMVRSRFDIRKTCEQYDHWFNHVLMKG